MMSFFCNGKSRPRLLSFRISDGCSGVSRTPVPDRLAPARFHGGGSLNGSGSPVPLQRVSDIDVIIAHTPRSVKWMLRIKIQHSLSFASWELTKAPRRRARQHMRELCRAEQPPSPPRSACPRRLSPCLPPRPSPCPAVSPIPLDKGTRVWYNEGTVFVK